MDLPLTFTESLFFFWIRDSPIVIWWLFDLNAYILAARTERWEYFITFNSPANNITKNNRNRDESIGKEVTIIATGWSEKTKEQNINLHLLWITYICVHQHNDDHVQKLKREWGKVRVWFLVPLIKCYWRYLSCALNWIIIWIILENKKTLNETSTGNKISAAEVAAAAATNNPIK